MSTGLSKFQKTGLIALLAAIALAFVDLSLATIPLAMLLLVFLAAPFLHQMSFFIPVISRGPSDRSAVALTFDDGPDPGTTPMLLQLLQRHSVRATFFVVGRRARKYPELIQAILDHGHTIGNHGFHHDSLAAFKGTGRVLREIDATQKTLAFQGVRPLVFRPPAVVTYPAMGRALAKLNLTAVTFSCRAWDRGNRSVARIAQRILARVQPGDIIMLHDRLPSRRSELSRWLGQMASVVTGIQRRGLTIVPLAELIGQPVDQRLITATPSKETG